MSQVERTPESRRKEEEIQALTIAIKKKRTSVKSLRTRLNNLKADIRAMQQKMGSAAMDVMEALVKMQASMEDVLQRLLRQKKIKLTKAQRNVIQGMLDQHEEMEELIEPNPFDSDGPSDEPAEEDTAQSDPFAAFQAEPAPEEKRQIRQVYLKLSQSFHPDMASNDRERDVFHRRMQQIAAAYQQHDIEALLRMEQQFLGDQYEDTTPDTGENLLDTQLGRLQRELSFLEKQAERLSEEIRNIRQSEVGQTLTDYDREEREGWGINTKKAATEAMFEQMKVSLDIMEDAMKKGKMTPELAEQLAPQPDPEALINEMLMQMFEEDSEEEWPSSPAGVPFQQKTWHNTRFQYGDLATFNPPKRAADTLLTPKRGTLCIILDIMTVGRDSLLDVICEPSFYQELTPEGWDIFNDDLCEFPLISIPEKDLKPYQGKGFDVEHSLALGRKKMYERLIDRESLSPETETWIRRVFLTNPLLSDTDALIDYLPMLKWPAKGVSASINHPDVALLFPGKKVGKVSRTLGVDPEEGIMVTFQNGRKEASAIPLIYLELVSAPARIMAFDRAYLEWANLRLPDDEGDDDSFGGLFG
jgi:hypothetical protein